MKKKLTKGRGGKSEVGEYRCYKDKSNVCYKTNMAELYFQLGIWGGGKWKWKWKGKKEEEVEEIKKNRYRSARPKKNKSRLCKFMFVWLFDCLLNWLYQYNHFVLLIFCSTPKYSICSLFVFGTNPSAVFSFFFIFFRFLYCADGFVCLSPLIVKERENNTLHT